ncbi:MAG: ABC transporter substrate-binding protein [Micromonosporaceae bacterium]|nr:ABC transporter substrate-binding protein [Micromonosporaceae bacterium]
MRCKRIITAASLLLLVLTAACTTSSDAASDADVVLAASLELTGSGQALGVAYERALKLEVDRVNSDGSLKNRRLRLTISDNRTESATALTQVTRFSADPEVTAVITGACGECATAVTKLVEDRKVPLIALAPGLPVVGTAQTGKYMFKIGLNARDTAAALTNELVRSGVRTVALLSPDDAYGKDGHEAMSASATKAGITIAASADFHPDETDFSAPAAAVVGADPDAVVVWAFPTQAALVATALRAAKYQGKIFLDGAAAGDLFLSETTTIADGSTMVFVPTLAIDDVIATTPAKAERRQWFEDYTSRYGVYQGASSFAADAVRLVVDAVNQAGSTDRTSVRNRLETMRTDGLSGPIRMAPNNHSGLMPQALTMVVARNGRWRLLG